MAAHRSSSGDLPGSYWSLSQRPLHILVFLLPLIVAYELGLAVVLRSDEGVISNVAHTTLLGFFEAFGIQPTGGLLLGGITIVVVLLIWHFLVRDSWRVDLRTIVMMALESAVLVLPLIVFGILIVRSAISAVALDAGGIDEAELDIWSWLAISIGAGLYEELIFRMVLISIVHTLLVDALKASNQLGAAIAIVVSAAAFTWYHPLEGPDGTLSMQRLVFFFVAGLYFGLLYVLRGFGIVVGVHALYDIVMVTSLESA